jgi:Rap guanine nucleotide exchange factor 4
MNVLLSVLFAVQYELIFHVFGSAKLGRITANLDLFLRRFNEVQYWVVTEMLLVTNVSKRVQLLKKFIKLASQYVHVKIMTSDKME